MNISKWMKSAALFGFALAVTAIPALAEEQGCCGDKNACKCCSSCTQSKKADCKAEGLKSGINPADFDTSVDLHKDFYHYAVGGWQKANPIPGDQARWGTFIILSDQNTNILHNALKEAAAKPGSDLERKLGAFYASGMDEKAIEQAGLSPVTGYLDMISAAATPAELQTVIVRLQSLGLNPYFSFDAAQDDKNSERMIATIWQEGLGLPERDYYLRTDENSKKLREKYTAYLTNLLKLSGSSDKEAAEKAAAVMALETKIAQASLPAAEMRDPQKMYNLLQYKDLCALTPHIDWAVYCKELGIDAPKEINVTGPDFMKSVDALLADESLFETHKDYLRLCLIRAAAPYLGSKFEQSSFNFYSRDLRGIKAMKPRWKRVTGTVGTFMDQGLGELYVKKAFSPESKQRVLSMVENIKAFMAERIPQLDWMSDTTKKQALKKLHSFRAKIGYPDVPRDYSSLQIGSSYCTNVLNSMKFEKSRGLAKIGKPVDRNEWYMPPQMVNAYYSPSGNEIVFPAGILQPPFFNPENDEAANYGGIGTVIGHEISHGFDDQGAQYDGDGNLRDWWTAEDKAKFQKLTKGVEDQFSSYKVQGQNLNGKLVLGESIADLSGLALSWGAYQRSLNGQEGRTIDGYTPAQRFFFNYAKIWAGNVSPEYERLQINTDPHPTANWRVNGPLSNMTEFYKAFDIKEGEPMRRPEEIRNRIW